MCCQKTERDEALLKQELELSSSAARVLELESRLEASTASVDTLGEQQQQLQQQLQQTQQQLTDAQQKVSADDQGQCCTARTNSIVWVQNFSVLLGFRVLTPFLISVATEQHFVSSQTT